MESVTAEEEELFEPSFSERFSLITNYFNFYYTPLLCLFGGFGNCVSLYIFCRSASHRNLSSSYYLSALAIADTGFLINVIALWITTGLGYNVVTTTISCPLAIYLSQVSCFMSVWLVVAFTVERFFAVCYPLTRPVVCTVARAKRVILAITCFALIAFSYAWVIAQVVQLPEDDDDDGDDGGPQTNLTNWISPYDASHEVLRQELTDDVLESLTHNQKQTFQEDLFSSSSSPSSISFSNELTDEYSTTTQPEPSNSTATSAEAEHVLLFCTVPKKYHDFSRYANYVDSFFTLILPFCIITFLNIRITMCVWKLKGQRENIVAAVPKLKSTSSYSPCMAMGSDLPNLPARTVTVPRFTCSFTKRPQRSLELPTSNSTSPTVNMDTTIEMTMLKQQQQQMQDAPLQSVPVGHQNNATTNKVHTPSTLRKLTHATQQQQQQSQSNAAEVRVTKTLLLVSTVFLVLNLPSHAMRVTAFIQEAFWPESLNHGIDLSAFHQWAYILFNTNFGVNFLLYCASGRNFRNALYSLLCCSNRRNRSRSRRGPGAGGGILSKRCRRRNSGTPYIRGGAGGGGGTAPASRRRNVSMRSRVLRSFTQCPSVILGMEHNRGKNHNQQQINLRRLHATAAAADDNRNVNADNDNDNTSFGGCEDDRRSSIQSTTFVTTFHNSEFAL